MLSEQTPANSTHSDRDNFRSPDKLHQLRRIPSCQEPLSFANIIAQQKHRRANYPTSQTKNESGQGIQPASKNNRPIIQFSTPIQRPVSKYSQRVNVFNSGGKQSNIFTSDRKPSVEPVQLQFTKKMSKKHSRAGSNFGVKKAQTKPADKENKPFELSFRNLEQNDKSKNEYPIPIFGQQKENATPKMIPLSPKNTNIVTPFQLNVQQQRNILTERKHQKINDTQQLFSLRKKLQFQSKSQFLNVSLEDFVKGKRLGKGHFGQVFIVRHKHTGFTCALKIISKQHIKNQKVTDQIVRQLKIHSYVKHPNIIQLYGFFFDNDNLYILQELCTDGQLFDLLKKKRRISEKYAAHLIRQLVEGIRYLHLNMIFHRDLKPQNILMENGVVKICDFGWAVHCFGMRNTRCGTPLYLSPEVVKGQPHDQRVDIWAVGVMTYELITGSIPFHIWCQEDVKKIAEDEVKFPSFLDITAEAKDFILKALNKDPNGRLSLIDLLYHPFLKKCNEMDFIREEDQMAD